MTKEEIEKMKRADLNQAYSAALEKIAGSSSDREKTLEAENQELKAQAEASAQREKVLQDKVEELTTKAESSISKEEVEHKDELIRQLNKRVSELDKKASVNKTEVEYKGKRYEVVIPAFRLPGSKEVINASELLNLPEVVAELVLIKSAILKEIKE